MRSLDAALRARRPAKPRVDPWRPIGWQIEEERLADGAVIDALTIFQAGAECPFTCVFCDLWRYTLDGETPLGALPAQLRAALAAATPRLGANPWLKLYNASNFFERRAVPPADDAEIARLAAPFSGVVVECHPRLIGQRCLRFAERLEGRLQVAMGLETIHPDAAARLNKGSTPDDFATAAERLRCHQISLRAFVLLGAPFVPRQAAVEWTLRSVEFALTCGAAHVSIVPVRGGNGEMERLAAAGLFTPPTLPQIEEVLDRCLELTEEAVITVDLWDVEPFVECPHCGPARIERLRRMQLSGRREVEVRCPGGCRTQPG